MREFMLQTKYVKITWVNFMKSKLNFPQLFWGWKFDKRI